MMLRVFRYAYGGAKVMALKSRLLNPKDYHFLLRARDLKDLVGYLRTTAYGPALADWDWRAEDAEANLSRRVYGELVQAFVKVRRGLRAREARFLEVLAQRLVVENLKVVLRALHQGLAREQAAARLLPLEGLTSLNFSELLKPESVAALAARLVRTPWGPPLARGLPRYQREESLFPLEMSLDLWVFAALRQGLKILSRADRRVAGQLLDTLAEITNIAWAGRFRDLYGFPGEEIYQYLMDAGRFAKPRPRRDLAFAPNLADLVGALPPPYGALLQGAADGAEVEARLQGHWLATLEKVLRLPPFQVGLPLTYLFLKELELDNLITLITGKLLNLSAERVAPLLKRRLPGGF
jgi:V/A-type H+-transporting ATPase subunit C